MKCGICQKDFNSDQLCGLDIVVFRHPGAVQKALMCLRRDEEALVYQTREIRACERCFYEAIQPLMRHLQRSDRGRALAGALLLVPVVIGLYFSGVTRWYEWGVFLLFCGAVAGKLYHDLMGGYHKKKALRALDVSDIKSITMWE